MKVYAQKQTQPQQETSSHLSRLTQRTTGKQPVQALPHENAEVLNANPEGRQAWPGTSAITRFAHDFSRIPARSHAPASIQSELMVNTPVNIYEQKPARAAERWNGVREQLLAIQKKSVAVSDPTDADEKEADEIARKVVDGQSAEIHGTGGTVNRNGKGWAEITPEFQSTLESSKGSGQSLDDVTRRVMESKMGADFNGVKVHTGSYAHELSEGIKAEAFTHGQDIYFKSGNYNPTSASGKELLAHELAHTQQQKGGAQRRFHRQSSATGAVDAVLDFTGITSTVETVTDIYHYAADSDEDFQRYMQAKLKAQINELKSSSSPSTGFKLAYVGMVGLATSLNPLSLFMMPSVDSLWALYVKGQLGYYTYLFNLGSEDITQQDEQGKEQTVKNKDYKKGGYAKVFANQMKNTLNPMFVVGEVKGIFTGIGDWFVDIWEVIKWLGSTMWDSVTDSWNLLVHQEPPPWMKTLTNGAISAANWLKENGKLILDFVGEMIRDPEETKKLGQDLKGALKSGAEDLAYTVGQRAAKAQVGIMNMSAEQQGEMVGQLIGYLIPEILIAIVSYSIVSWIKAGILALKALRATKVVTKLFEAARWVVRAFEKVVQVIKQAGSRFKKLGEMFDKVLDYFKGLGRVEKEASTLSEGSKLAKLKGLPEAEEGYFWVKNRFGELEYRKRPGYEGPKKKYDPKTGQIEERPAFERKQPKKNYQKISGYEKAKFGTSKTANYRKTFSDAFPKVQGKVVVHHAVEQQSLKLFPELVSKSEMHSLENLRGIPKEINAELHLRKINPEWNKFYKMNPKPTKEQLLEKATEIDNMFGHLFDPPIR